MLTGILPLSDYKGTTFGEGDFRYMMILADISKFVQIIADYGLVSIQKWSAIHLTTLGGNAPLPLGIPRRQRYFWWGFIQLRRVLTSTPA